MKQYFLNYNNDWRSLPHKKIYLRVLMIQTQIYNATKAYNLNYTHKLQNYLLNCNEGKIFSIDKVLKDIYKYYYFYSKELYLTTSYKKFTILKFLFNINTKFFTTKIDTVIKEKIKQYLIYLSIEPEWKAKFSKTLNKKCFIEKFNVFLKSSFGNFYYIEKYQSLKYTLTNILIFKLKSTKYIKQSILKWLYNNFCINLNNFYNIKLIKYKPEKINTINYTVLSSLSILLLNIIYLDFTWYHFYNKHISYILKYTNLSNSSNLQKTIISLNYNLLLVQSIKLFLYNKNNFNQLKVKTFIDKHFLFNKSKNILQNYYYNNLQYITFDLIKYTNKIFNTIMYYWLKKTIKINFYLLKKQYTQISNSSLNHYLYNYNINCYYKNKFVFTYIVFDQY